jgi:hypothetical protein
MLNTILTSEQEALLIEKGQPWRLRFLDMSGDMRFTWDSADQDEVDAIKKLFDEKIKAGWTAFKVKKDGEAGSVMKRFDSKAEKVIMTPPISGG